MRVAWSPAITLNDDGLPVSHSFHNMGVGPDGTIYVAWLDGRDKQTKQPQQGGAHASHQRSEGTSSVYLARSIDGGKTFEKNVRVATDICPCCRVSIRFVKEKVVIAWRRVEPGDICDIYVANSSDKGQTWSQPALVARDGWKISGCPHVGPTVGTLGNKLFMAWFTEGSGDPGIYMVTSDDAGQTFSAKEKVSEGTFDPTHPLMVPGQDKLALVFQARDVKKDQGWGKVGVYYREIYTDGSKSELVRAGEGKTTANFPTVALGLSGRIFVGWTETSEGVSKGYCVRGRLMGKTISSAGQ